ncbi:MAG: hypothetical protein A3A86_05740 [Elusimicrobia bacterium RIFCSPLOWO2_01_FULL_60_11]|nr:MAG: hypothetical protein A3A86_05740 [Elusimicrobia bacterium RIFCSPLOWO2_01_FULL_60_11]
MFDRARMLGIAVSCVVLSGCSVLNMFGGKKEKPAVPRVLVMGVECGNAEIGDLIAKGLLSNVTPSVESFDSAGFEVLISCITLKRRAEAPVIDFSSSTFYGKLEKSQYFRTKINLEVDLDYVIVGEAKEKKLSDLEEGNLVTAQTAGIKMLSLHDGSFPVKADFKQGIFEIVAPDRIGAKLADKVNKYLKTVRKAAKKEAKALRGN